MYFEQLQRQLRLSVEGRSVEERCLMKKFIPLSGASEEISMLRRVSVSLTGKETLTSRCRV